MKKDTIVGFADPAGISPDPLTDVLRKGARDLLVHAVEAEVSELLASHAHLTDAAGRQRLVRHGQGQPILFARRPEDPAPTWIQGFNERQR